MTQPGLYVELAPDWTENAWVQFPRRFARDRSLSFRARGVALLLASHAPSYRMSVEILVGWGTEGRDAVRTAVRELERAGWLTRFRPPGESGGVIVYQLHAEPVLPDGTPSADFQPKGSPDGPGGPSHPTENPPTENPPALIRNSRAVVEVTHPSTGPSLEIADALSREGPVDGGRASAHAPTREAQSATRLPDGWQPKASTIEWAKRSEPNVDLRREHEKFTDHWLAAAGASARKRDWDAAWRNWIRRAADQSPRRGTSPTAASTTDARVSQALDLAAYYRQVDGGDPAALGLPARSRPVQQELFAIGGGRG
jgi:hypothetical protein